MNEAESFAQVLGNESKAFQADLSDSGEAVKLFERVVFSKCQRQFGVEFRPELIQKP